MKRPWTKMCGFTQPMDVREAVRAGVDLVGLNFHSGSPRAVSFGLAQRLCSAMRDEAQRRSSDRPARSVAIFVDPDEELVRDVMEQVAPDVLQFHGDEGPDFCQSFKHPFLKAFRIQSVADAARVPEYSGDWSIGYLVDAWSDAAHGGTGRALGVDTARAALSEPKGFLAGGLRPDNVGDLVRELRPFGVDVASGIETRPGIKSAKLMVAFMQEVETACRG